MPISTRTILIVDDNKSILRVFSKVFERRGYAVTAVSTGKDATGEIERNCFDATLIDIHLPDMKGTSLLPKIQARSANTVKVVFTGSPDMDCLCKEEKDIIDAFLIKPINPEIVIDILRKKNRAENSLRRVLERQMSVCFYNLYIPALTASKYGNAFQRGLKG